MIRMLAVMTALTLVGTIGAVQARTKAEALPARPELRVQNIAPRIPAAEFRRMAPLVGDAGLFGRSRLDAPVFLEPPHTRDAANPNRATD